VGAKKFQKVTGGKAGGQAAPIGPHRDDRDAAIRLRQEDAAVRKRGWAIIPLQSQRLDPGTQGATDMVDDKERLDDQELPKMPAWMTF
jgi:hypothetical protein